MIEVVLPWPSRDLSPNGRVHWARKAKAAKAAKHEAYALARAAGWTGGNLPDGKLHLWVDFFPPTRMIPDDDNMLARFKAQRDALALALGIDDRRFVSHPMVHDQPRKGGQVVVSLTAEP